MLNRSYEQLMQAADAGETVTRRERWLSHETGVLAVMEALKNHDGPVVFRLFEPGEDSFGQYVNRPFAVDDVEEFDDRRVFSVTAADNQPVGTVEFMIEHFNQSRMPNEVSLVSFSLEVVPVPELTQSVK